MKIGKDHPIRWMIFSIEYSLKMSTNFSRYYISIQIYLYFVSKSCKMEVSLVKGALSFGEIYSIFRPRYNKFEGNHF